MATSAVGIAEQNASKDTRAQRLSASTSRAFTQKQICEMASHSGNWRWRQKKDDSKTKAGGSAKMVRGFGQMCSSQPLEMMPASWSVSEKSLKMSQKECRHRRHCKRKLLKDGKPSSDCTIQKSHCANYPYTFSALKTRSEDALAGTFTTV